MPSTHPRFRTLPGDLFRSLSSFADLELRITALPEELMRGDALEVFVEGYLRTSTIWQVTELALVGQVPGDWLRELNLSNNPTGIDGVFRSKDGGLVPYQVKFRTGRPQVGVAEVSTFLGLTERGVRRVLIANSSRYATDIECRDRLRIVRGSDLDAITQDELHDISHWIYGQPVRPSRHSPRPHQANALADINAALASNNRATCVMACATGKTLVALWAAEAQQPRTVLVLLPSLALLGQTLSEWSRHTTWGERFEYRCVCSDPTVAGNPGDSWEVRSTEIPFPIDTDATGVRHFLSRPQSDVVRVVFSTYHSSPIVAAGLPDGLEFDLGIFDEAHQTTGSADSTFAFALHDDTLRISKRLFFTATPRHIDVRHKDREGDFRVVSMDDPAVYGPRAHTLTFADAVSQDLVCDYRVVVSVVDPQELPHCALQRGITLVQGDEMQSRWVAVQIALQRAIADTGVSKVITFHSRVAHARDFAGDTTRGIGQFLDGFHVGHVNGTQPVAYRKDVLRGFADDTRRLVANARCLTEGVDLPAVDMVAFCNPRSSTVDIVQAVGRAMRKPASGKKTVGYVVVPALLPQSASENLEEAAADTHWDDLISVLAALREHDARLHATLQTMQISRGEERSFNPRDLFDRISVIGPRVSIQAIERSITSRVLKDLAEVWDLRYGELVAFRSRCGHCNVPYKYPDNPELAAWVIRQRGRKSRSKLSPERIKRLDALGFVWDLRADSWEEMFAALAAFRDEKGHCKVPSSYPENPDLAVWAGNLREFKRRGALSPDRIQRLEALGFVWELRAAAWEEMFAALAAFREEKGHCNVTRNDPSLGTWVTAQRRFQSQGKLSPERIRRLESLGFKWDPLTAAWEEMFATLKAFQIKTGHCNVPNSRTDTSGLGTWVTYQRNYRRSGKLSPERIRRLEALGFVWDPYDASWVEMFAALVAFKDENGHCNVPATYPANPTLGNWVPTQRSAKKRGKLSPERIQQLETLGIMWDPIAAAWEEMFMALTAFKDEKGHCNVPSSYPHNHALARWVVKQREAKKRGVLSSDRITRLDALGFVWTPRLSAWDSMFAALVAFMDEAGHCNVSALSTNNKALARWVNVQRTAKRLGNLSPDRIQRLESLGFLWAPRNA
jgi:superfamily II DNA or RNA helicase